MKFFVHRYRWEIGIGLLALLVHLALFFVVVQMHDGDVLSVVRVDDGYYELTENVLAGNGFSWSAEAPYEPNPLRTPGYIYVLAALISVAGTTGAALIQIFLSSLIPIFGMYIARFIANSKKVGIATGVILAVDPTLAFLSFQFYTDTLFILLFLPWLLLTLHYSKKPTLKILVISAIVLGLAALVRPVVQYVPFFIALCIMWQFGRTGWKTALTHIGIYFAIVGLILAPWIVRNIMTFDTAGMSAQTPFILYTNLTPAVLSVANDTNFVEERDAFLTPREFKGDAITLVNGSEYTAKSIEIIQEYPSATAYVMGRALFTFFTVDGFHALISRLGAEPQDYIVFLVVSRLVWIFITLSAFVGMLVYILTKRTAWAVLIVVLIGYFALTSTLAAFGTNPRYRLPVTSLIIPLAAIGYGATVLWCKNLWLLVSARMNNIDKVK